MQKSAVSAETPAFRLRAPTSTLPYQYDSVRPSYKYYLQVYMQPESELKNAALGWAVNAGGRAKKKGGGGRGR